MRIRRIPFITRFGMFFFILMLFYTLVSSGYLVLAEFSWEALVIFIVGVPLGIWFYRLYKNDDIAFMGEMTKEEREAYLKNRRESLGDFIYNEKGFTWDVYNIEWQQVDEIVILYHVGYLDTYSIGIRYGENKFIVDEDTPGYTQFIETVEKNFKLPDSIYIILLNVRVDGDSAVSIWRREED